MKTNDIATELDRAFAAATRNALMDGVVLATRLTPCTPSTKHSMPNMPLVN